MKLLFWNLGYARGIDGSPGQLVRRGRRLVKNTRYEQKTVLDAVSELVLSEAPDLFAYAEILTGARRNQRLDQHVYLESVLNCSSAHAATKYASGTLAKMPLHIGNGNGICAMVPMVTTGLHFTRGGKTLVLKVEVEDCTIFVVHLSIVARIRREQLRELAGFVSEVEGNVIVCGDLNIFRGAGELDAFTAATGFIPALPETHTFPAHAPRRTLDGFLIRSGSKKKYNVRTIPSVLSDHLPVILEF